MSFWARQKFPVIAVAFIFKKDADLDNIGLYINGLDARHFSDHLFDLGIDGEHVSLFDLRCLFRAEELPILDNFLGEILGWS